MKSYYESGFYIASRDIKGKVGARILNYNKGDKLHLNSYEVNDTILKDCVELPYVNILENPQVQLGFMWGVIFMTLLNLMFTLVD